MVSFFTNGCNNRANWTSSPSGFVAIYGSIATGTLSCTVVISIGASTINIYFFTGKASLTHGTLAIAKKFYFE
jgi:hypothetical protein